MHRMKFFLLASIFIMIAVPLAGCGSQHEMAFPNDTPEYIMEAPPTVQEAYHYAMTHPDELEKYPCYCGCGNMGHTSNLDCFIGEMEDDGSIVWDNHAAGCGICVDIAQDVIRLKDKGMSSPEIRDYIDTTYSPFGPGTDTPYPQS